MKSKLQEQSLIWENYMTNFGSQEDAEMEASQLPNWASEFDEGDLAAGVYHWAADNHGGQSSPGYMALSIISKYYTPGRMSTGPEPESGESFVYDSIQSEDEALAIAEYIQQMMDASDDNDEDGEDLSSSFEDDDDDHNVVMSFDTSEPVEVDHNEDHGDHENSERDDMIRSELLKLVEFTTKLQDMAKDADFEEWMAAKITKASDYVTDVYFRLATKADYANCGCGD